MFLLWLVSDVPLSDVPLSFARRCPLCSLVGKCICTGDANGDGVLEITEFAYMVKFANPSAGKRRIVNAFVAAVGNDAEHVDTERLVPALQV